MFFLHDNKAPSMRKWNELCNTHFWNSHSRLSSGQTCLVFSQREMQWKWKACYKMKENYHRDFYNYKLQKVHNSISRKNVTRRIKNLWSSLRRWSTLWYSNVLSKQIWKCRQWKFYRQLNNSCKPCTRNTLKIWKIEMCVCALSKS